MLNYGTNGPSVSDIAAVMGNRNTDGFNDGNCWWILIILFALFGGWGGNYGRNGYNGEVATASTQADIQRGFDTQAMLSKLNGLENGLCDGFYAMNTSILQSTNALQNAIQQNALSGLQNTYTLQNAIQNDTVANMQNTNSLSTQMANGFCEDRQGFAQMRYDMATDTCAITTAITQAAQQIMQNDNDNYRAIYDKLVNNELAAKDQKISEQQAIIQSLNLAASQQAQNNAIISSVVQQLRGSCCSSLS